MKKIKLLNKKPYLTFNAEFLRRFANNLMHISVKIAESQPNKYKKKFKKITSYENEEIKTK